MYSKMGQSSHSMQKVGQSSTKNIGQMATHNKPNNVKSAQPNIQEQVAQYNKYSK